MKQIPKVETLQPSRSVAEIPGGTGVSPVLGTQCFLSHRRDAGATILACHDIGVLIRFLVLVAAFG